MLKYVEKCTGGNHTGPAWIGRVRASKSGRTLYFNGHAFKRSAGGNAAGNHYDADTGDEYWISGVKADGRDRHWAGSGQISISPDAVEEYLALVGSDHLDETRFRVAPVKDTDIAEFHERENVPFDE